MKKRGFTFIEIIVPCSTLYARKNKLGSGLDLMRFYHDNSVIRHGAKTEELNIEFQQPIIVGKFIDRERPTFLDGYNTGMKKALGDKFVPYGKDGGDE